jgi:hypothetical protein
MADLSDFLGHILEEITRARVSADAEAIRMAKRYASDPDGLLKYFPVPRLRLPTVEITAPMIVSFVPEGHVEKTDPQLLQNTLASDLSKLLTKQKVQISTAEITKIIKADPLLSKGYLTQASTDALSAGIASRLKPPGSRSKSAKEAHAEVTALIRNQVDLTLQTLPVSSVGIGIDATTSSVREFNRTAAQGANVLYVKMSISEEALEIEFEEPSQPDSAEQQASSPGIRRLSPE